MRKWACADRALSPPNRDILQQGRVFRKDRTRPIVPRRKARLEADLVRLSLGLLFLIGLWVLVRLRTRTAGRLLMLIGFLHILGGAWVGRGPLGRIVQGGFFGEADSALGHVASQIDKELVFWFMLW